MIWYIKLIQLFGVAAIITGLILQISLGICPVP